MSGGWVRSIRSFTTRFTGDIDVAVAVESPAQSESIGLALQRQGYEVSAVIEQEQMGQLAAVRLSPPVKGAGDVTVDLLFASSGVESELVRSATLTEIADRLEVPVAIAPDLLALKILSVSEDRPMDVADIQALIEVCGPAELERTRQLLGLIEERGFQRGRNLQQMLILYLARFRDS